MIALICFVLALLASPFKFKSRLEAENAVLRHQLIVLRRKVRGRVQPTNNDRWFLVQIYRWFPSILKIVMIVQPSWRHQIIQDSATKRARSTLDRQSHKNADPSALRWIQWSAPALACAERRYHATKTHCRHVR